MIRDIAAGIDTSTQSCTIALRKLSDGTIIAESRTKHPSTTPPCSEQYPEDWWEALISAFKELKEYLPRIASIAVGGQGHGLVTLDEKGNSLRKAKLWNDTESAPDAECIKKLINEGYWETHIGSIPGPALTISKLVWTERNYKGLLERAKYVMLPADYIIFKLTGKFVTERGGGSGTGYLNPYTDRYDVEILKKCLPYDSFENKLPEIVPSSHIAGEVRLISGLEELEGAVVGMGTGDNMAAAIGLNAKEGDAVFSIGTSGTVYSIISKEIKNTYRGMVNFYADATDRYMPMITTLNAAKVTDAFARILGVKVEEFDRLALEDETFGNDLVLIPYLDGERAPNLPLALGTLNGIRSDVKRGQIASAAVKGVVCNLLNGLEILKNIGVKFNGKIILTGGGSKSAAYRQYLSDLSSQDVYVCGFVETAAAGAALFGASAYKQIDIKDLMDEWSLGLKKAATPRNINYKEIKDAYAYYAKKYEEYTYGK